MLPNKLPIKLPSIIKLAYWSYLQALIIFFLVVLKYLLTSYIQTEALCFMSVDHFHKVRYIKVG